MYTHTYQDILKIVLSQKEKFKRKNEWRSELKKELPWYEFDSLQILTIESLHDIYNVLCQSDISFKKFMYIINKPEYIYHTILKERGGWRGLDEPSAYLKEIQRNLCHFLQAYYLCLKPDEVHGFVKSKHKSTYCNIVANAQPHVNKRFVLSIDLTDFFPSISAKRVKEMFASEIFQFNEQVAIALTFIATYCGRLPTGAPSSPVISNFVCLALDKSMAELSRAHQLVYTRYADDLTFSSDTPINTAIISVIINIIQENHFQINIKKFRLKSSYGRQIVTGIVVNKKLNIDRRKLKKIRAMLHDLKQNGPEAASDRHFGYTSSYSLLFLRRLEGYINFVGQVRGKDDALYIKMKSEFTTMNYLN